MRVFLFAVFVALCVLLVSKVGYGQEHIYIRGPVSATDTATWVATAPSLDIAQLLQPRARVDQPVNGPFIPLANPTCLAIVAPDPDAGKFRCRTPVGAVLAQTLNVLGEHRLTITLFDPRTNTDGDVSLPFPLPSPPGAATEGTVTPSEDR